MIHIGSAYLAALKPAFRRCQVLCKLSYRGLAELHDSLIAEHVHISRRRVKKHGLFGGAKVFAASFDSGFGFFHRVVGAKPIENVLLQNKLSAARVIRSTSGV